MKYTNHLYCKIIPLAVLSTYIITGCHSNESSKNNEQSKDSTKHKVYITEKQDCEFTDKDRSDSTFTIDSSKVTVSISYECKGNYDVINDTDCRNDTCHIDVFRNQYVLIKIKTTKEKEMVISKDFFVSSTKNINNLQHYLLDMTRIDSIDVQRKQIIFRTFIVPPIAVGGNLAFSAFYSVALLGEEKSVRFLRMDSTMVTED